MRSTSLYIVFLLISCILLTSGVNSAYAQRTDYMFKHLGVSDGLSNSQVNCIYKDSRGNMWFGTASGLNRFDGFSCKVFVNQSDDSSSIPDGYVSDIQELADGTLLIETASGYVFLSRKTLRFNSDLRSIQKEWKLPAVPTKIRIDSDKNIWSYVPGKGIFLYRPSDHSSFSFLQGNGKGLLPKGTIFAISEDNEGIVLTYDTGLIVGINSAQKRVTFIDDYPKKQNKRTQFYSTLRDTENNIWVVSPTNTCIWIAKNKKWYNSLDDLGLHFIAEPFSIRGDMTKCITEDSKGNIWMGTDRTGLVKINLKNWNIGNYRASAENVRSLRGNSVESVYATSDGMLWVGTYKDGVSFFGESIFKFDVTSIKDVTTIAEAKNGSYWLGTTEGLICYNTNTGEKHLYTKTQCGLESDVIVSSLITRSGTMWIGTFWGGLTKYENGRFNTLRHKEGDNTTLGNDNIWALAEDAKGLIWVGTLGSGVQCLDPKTNKIIATYNEKNSGLSNDYVSSVHVCRDGKILVGTSFCVSLLDPHKKNALIIGGRDFTKYGFSNSNVIQVMEDSRGLFWIATRQGLNVIDMKRDTLYTFKENPLLGNQMISGITEDKKHTMWVTTSGGVANVLLEQLPHTHAYTFQSLEYDERDGLQGRDFNQRSILCARNGDILMGGLYGLNHFNPNQIRYNEVLPNVFFSDLMLFNEEVKIGQEYDGRVLLPEDINEIETLTLDYSQNVITLVLGSDNYSLPEKMSFRYKLDGFNKDWLIGSPSQRNITYTNLTPGTYTLRVKAINSDGYAGDQERELKIVVLPPFWRSTWAYFLYFILVVGGIYWWRRDLLRRQREHLKMVQIQEMSRKDRELDDLKLRFFTNVSHELRTPLSLIISPLATLVQEETNVAKHDTMVMIHRNAVRLLNMVNQLLDFRKNDVQGLQLNLISGDIINYVNNLCYSFESLADKKIHLNFSSDLDTYVMEFDEDKLGKIINNLLSNAFKFTPIEGHVNVHMRLVNSENKPSVMEMTIADDGCGISDEDKPHIFERFYQANNQSNNLQGGSGVGLNLVYEFVALHKGDIRVLDNTGGGTVFIINLPVQRKENASSASIPVIEPKDTSFKAETKGIVTEKVETDTCEEKDNLQVESQNYTVLVVDDNQDFLDFLAGSLAQYYKVITAHDGVEALELMRKKTPDLIVCDNMMPRMDGNELCRIIKEDSKMEHIPFIMLTARLADEHRLESLHCGVDDYLTKPFNMEELYLRVTNLLKWHEKRQNAAFLQPRIAEHTITSLDEKLIQKATAYVEENLSRDDLSVEEFSNAMCMSRVHLYKKLLSITGKSPIEFIRYIRLEHAEQLLRKSQLSVSEVAYQVGFNNPRYFSKYFKEIYGMLPSVYRNLKAE